jgi:hypothetical protein
VTFALTRLLACALCLAACATASPRQAAQSWTSRSTEHFLIHSDAGAGSMQLTAERLEEVYAALSRSFFGDAHVPLVEVMVFYDPAHYRSLAGDTAGAFYSGIGRTGSVLVMNDRSEGDRDSFEHLVAHELTHRFVNSQYGALPNWLHEGLAMFFGAVVVDNDRLEFGAAPRAGGHVFPTAGGVNFSDLLAVRPARLYGNEASFYYTASWGLVHYLFTAEGGALRARLPQLLEAINQAVGDPAQIQRAFSEVYPDKSVLDFDAAIERNNQRIRGTVPDRVLRMAFARPERPQLRPAVDQQAERDEIARLFRGLERRRERAPETDQVLLERPRYARAEIHLDLDRPTYFGLAAGKMLAAHTAAEAELGLGELGLMLAPRVRQFFQVGDDGTLFVTVGAGPLLALDAGHGTLSEYATGVPTEMTPNPAAAAFLGGLASEVGAEIRTPSNVLMRISVNGYLGWATAGVTQRRELTARGSLGWTF